MSQQSLPVVHLTRDLVEYAYKQTCDLKETVQKQVKWVAGLALYIVIATISVAVMGTKVVVTDPYFVGPGGAQTFTPIINRDMPLQTLKKYAEEYAVKIASLHFRRQQEQVAVLQQLYVDGEFRKWYYDPLTAIDAFNKVTQTDAIITAAPIRTRLNAAYLLDGVLHYDYVTRVVQTRQDLSGEPDTTRGRVFVTLIPVTRDVNPDGVQILKSSIQRY